MSKEPKLDLMDNLPHLVIEEDKRSKASIFAIVFFTFLLLAVPIGVYLTLQKTDYLPRASTGESRGPEVSITLAEAQPSLADKEMGLTNVNVIAKTDFDQANLVSVKMNFDPNQIEVVEIATNSAIVSGSKQDTLVSSWIENYFDNEQGKVSLSAGFPNPGVKTSSEDSGFIKLASISFHAKQKGASTLTVDPQSQILRNSDNANILLKTGELKLQLPEGTNRAVSLSGVSILKKDSKPEPPSALTMIYPSGGEVLPYFSPSAILWQGPELSKILSVTLYINGKLFSTLGLNFPAEQKFEWNPSQTLALPYINSTNTYQIGILAIDKKGGLLKTISSGPFGISTETNPKYQATPSATLISSFNSVADFSKMLSNYNLPILKDAKYDLNQDGLVNGIDFWLLRRVMLQKRVIKGF